MIFWDLYEIKCDSETLHNVKLRGRIRKFTIENDITCLLENAQDEENTVRFGLITGADSSLVVEFVKNIIPDADIVSCLKNIPNPVLSKLKVNDPSRYEI